MVYVCAKLISTSFFKKVSESLTFFLLSEHQDSLSLSQGLPITSSANINQLMTLTASVAHLVEQQRVEQL